MDVYGRDAYEFRENSIVVNIQYERLETAWTTSREMTEAGKSLQSDDEKLAIERDKVDIEPGKVDIEKKKQTLRIY